MYEITINKLRLKKVYDRIFAVNAGKVLYNEIARFLHHKYGIEYGKENQAMSIIIFDFLSNF